MTSRPPQHATASRAPGGPHSALIILGLILVATIALRYRLLEVPLDRDEGGFAYMGQLTLDGIAPNAQANDYKPPGVQLVYSLFIVCFGPSPVAIHLGFLLINLGTVATFFFLVRNWSDTAGAAVAAFTLAVLLTSPSILGFVANATHFVIFFALAGCLFLERHLRGGSAGNLVAAGVAFGCAVLMKQSGIVFFLFGITLLLMTRRERGKSAGSLLAASGMLFGGSLIPAVGLLVWLGAAGALERFIFWNLLYPSMLATEAGNIGLLPKLINAAVGAAGRYLPAWLAGVAGTVFLFYDASAASMRTRITLFFLLSLAGVFFGYVIRSHYFVLVLPAIAAATGVTVSRLRLRRWPSVARAGVVAFPCLLVLVGTVCDREYYFQDDPATISRKLFDPNQFEDMAAVGEFIRTATTDTDRIAVLGSEPELFYLSGRRSASRYIYTYVFNEKHLLRENFEADMIGEIDSVRPAMIVMINQPFSWGALPKEEWTILRWAKTYLQNNYEIAATVTRNPGRASQFRWEDDARRDPVAPGSQIVIYRRLPGRAGHPPPG